MTRNPLPVLAVVAVAASLLSAPARADGGRDGARDAVKLIKTIPVPGLTVFDISWVDPDTQLYYLADRSNKVIEVVDAQRDVLVKQIHGNFKGFTGNNDTSGPNGVVVSGHWLFVTDAPSRIVTIDLRTDAIVSEVSTGGAAGLRADELAFDPVDNLLLPVNNADDPPFATLIKVEPETGALSVVNRITFEHATNGAEQPVFDPNTGKFYISIPEMNGVTADGAVGVINASGVLEAELPVKFCQPAGLALGPRNDLLLGCAQVFDTAGKPFSASDTNAAAPTQIIMDTSGAIDAVVAGVGGSDEVWFNPGDGRFYTASRNNPGSPVLGVIDAFTQKLVQVAPTFNTPSSAPPPRGTGHSIAVNPHNNHIFLPLPPNNVFAAPTSDPSANCLKGCIAVFAAPGDDD
jgi:hypothetical protein